MDSATGDEFATLVTQDPVRARVEIWKHLDGDLELVPGPHGTSSYAGV